MNKEAMQEFVEHLASLPVSPCGPADSQIDTIAKSRAIIETLIRSHDLIVFQARVIMGETL